MGHSDPQLLAKARPVPGSGEASSVWQEETSETGKGEGWSRAEGWEGKWEEWEGWNRAEQA